MKKEDNKKGQMMSLPYGMIFSIILIIFFVAFAFYAINFWLKMQKCANIGIFKDELEREVKSAIAGDEALISKKLNLPSELEEVCFIDRYPGSKAAKDNAKIDKLKRYFDSEEKKNMFFIPPGKACESEMAGFQIKGINVTKTIEVSSSKKNPFCLENKKGKVSLKIRKEFGDNLAVIEVG